LCYIAYRGIAEFHQWSKSNPHTHNVGYGEGIVYSGILLIAVAMIFALVILINIIISKKIGFYLWLMMIILVQTIIILNIG